MSVAALAQRMATALTVLAVSASAFGADSETDKSVQEQPAVPENWVRLSPTDEVWIDAKKKQVIVGGKICFRRGLLEMFACPKGTKEHESVVAVNSRARLIHTGLLAIGAKPGSPVQYQPEYVAATGMPIQVEVEWKTPEGKTVRRRAQEMIRHVRTREPLKEDWIFAGSGFWEDESTGKRFYQAEGGELICVSNFSTAMLDLPVKSSQANSDLLFEALTDKIPALGTNVRLILTVKAKDEVGVKAD